MPDDSKAAARPLKPEELFWHCPDSCLKFQTTADLAPLEGTIGQARALEALSLGLSLYAPGYNMFVCGLSGTRKMETIEEILEHLEPQCALPQDRAYVHNFRLADEPILLNFPRGRVREFARQMDQLVGDLCDGLSSLQREESLARRRQKVVRSYEERGQEIFRPFEEEAKEKGFALVQVAEEGGIRPQLVPTWEGEPVNWGDLEKKVEEGTLTQEEYEARREAYGDLAIEMQQLLTRSMNLGRSLRHELRELTREIAGEIVEDLVGMVREGWEDGEIQDWLDTVETAVLEDLELFLAAGDGSGLEESDEESGQEHLHGRGWHEDPFVEYRVKVVLSAEGKERCPIIVEQSPTYQNVFGTVEYAAIDGTPTTNHTRIKAGDMLEADGGYLVLDAYDALSEPGVWTTLKRTMLHQKLQLQPVSLPGHLSVPIRLKPEPIDISTKVIMVGDRSLFQWMYHMDEDFRRVFKVLVDFDSVVDLNDDTVELLARFMARMVQEEDLAPFSRDAVALVVNHAVRLAEDREKLTARLNLVADLMREADHLRAREGGDVVDGSHVLRSLESMEFRENLLEEKIQESIRRQILLVDTEGERVGVVNGLSVYDLGSYSFGRPTRISASVSVGRGGILNIEREADLSGSSHDKGVLILGGYLRHRFARDKPLGLEAALAFEQSYSEVDGDSASSAECYALLSELSGLPLRQDLAVTGSINQKGDLQAIGGVNEKIEGFFRVCRQRGLTGTQGVLIPASNVQHLALRTEVVEAVRAGEFHVYCADHVDQGLALLTGREAGVQADDGSWPEESANGLAAARLEEMSEEVKSLLPEEGDSDG